MCRIKLKCTRTNLLIREIQLEFWDEFRKKRDRKKGRIKERKGKG